MLSTKSILTFSAALLISAGCTAHQPVDCIPAKKSTNLCATSVSGMINDADKALKKAESVNGAWRDTNKFIKKAKTLADEGHCSQAVKWAKKAKMEGVLGYEQAVSQKMLKMPEYFKF